MLYLLACGECPAHSYCYNDDADPHDAECRCVDGYETHENDPDDAGATGIVCYGKIQYEPSRGKTYNVVSEQV